MEARAPNKMTGCPNCNTEEENWVWGIERFTRYNDLVDLGRFGRVTQLSCCHVCKTKYLRVEEGHLLHQLSSKHESWFLEFFDLRNVLSDCARLVLRDVGSPKGIREYPVQVRTKDGGFYPHAVIRLDDYIWPVAEREPLHFLSEIEEIFPSDEAMTLIQREAAYTAPGMMMGEAPIWLVRRGKVHMTYYGQYFIPREYGHPSEFEIDPTFGSPEPAFRSVPIARFIGHASR